MTAHVKQPSEIEQSAKKEKPKPSTDDTPKQPEAGTAAPKKTSPDTPKLPKQKKEAARESAPTLYLKVYSPYRVYYEGRVSSVSAENATGPFDILPKHHNFITLLLPCDMIVRAENEAHRIRIQGGMMHIKSDEVIVFLDV